jgi:hypothetical protein
MNRTTSNFAKPNYVGTMRVEIISLSASHKSSIKKEYTKSISACDEKYFASSSVR